MCVVWCVCVCVAQSSKCCYYYYCYCIDRHIYLNVSKSTQSAVGLKAFWSLLPMCKSLSACQQSACWVFSSFHPGSLTCVSDHCCVCVYAQGLGTPTTSQHNIFYLETLTNFSCVPDEIRISVLWILSLTLYQLNALPLQVIKLWLVSVNGKGWD